MTMQAAEIIAINMVVSFVLALFIGSRRKIIHSFIFYFIICCAVELWLLCGYVILHFVYKYW